MPRTIPAERSRFLLLLGIALVLWAVWCVFSINVLVPEVERHLSVYQEFAAWVLCMLPVLALGSGLLLRADAERS